MYGQPGHAYLYLVYGMYTCLNVVTEPAGRPSAILIRAVELIDGIAAARTLRTRHETGRKGLRDDPAGQAAVAARIGATPVARLASGPGLVGASFGLRPELSGLDLCDPSAPLRLEPGLPVDPVAIRASPRIGIGYAGEPWTDQPWRFTIVGHPALSGPRPRATG
jgi:DNA-3-methyladenine glycosylase